MSAAPDRRAPRPTPLPAAGSAARQRGIDALPMHLPVRLGGAGMTQTKAAPVRVLGFDQALVWVTFALLAWGLVMVYSASIALPDNPRFARRLRPVLLPDAPRAVPGHRVRRRRCWRSRCR